MKKIVTILMSVCLLASTMCYAQDDEMLTSDIPDINIRGFRGVKSIFDKNTNEVISHYMYFNNGASLEVIFLDLELQITKRVPLTLATGDIQEAVFNGETILFYTLTSGISQYYTLSLDGEILGQFASSYVFTEDGKTMPAVVPSEIDNSFYLLNPKAKDPSIFGAYIGYEIVKIDAQFASQWSKSFFPGKKKEGIMLQTAESGFDRLIVIESNMSNWMTNKMTGTELVCFDGNNGDELYRSAMYDNSFTSLPTQIVVDVDGNISLGGEYFKGSKTKNTNSVGIFVSKLDASGSEQAQNRSSWKDGIQKQMKRGAVSLSGKNKVVFHDIVASEDGGFQLIGESFSKKQTLGKGSFMGALAGAALQTAGVSSSTVDDLQEMVDLKNFIVAVVTGKFIGEADPDNTPTIMTIQDILVFDYDEDLELTNVNKVEKAYTKVYSYPPYTGVGGITLAKIMKGYGFFDYSFTQADAESGKQVLVYNSMLSKEPHIGVVDIEKGSESVPKKFVVKNLKKYGGFDADAEEKEVEEEEEVEDGEKKKKKKKLKFSNVGVAKANEGKVVIYYIEKEKKSKTGTLKMFHDTIDTGL